MSDFPLHSVSLIGNRPFTTSLAIADHFEKKHKNVLRDLETLLAACPENFGRLNFELSSYTNEQNKQQSMYHVFFDGFILLVMGYTGPKALKMKLAYIEAFNGLEKLALERQTELGREAGYLEGRQADLSGPEFSAAERAAYEKGFQLGRRLAEKRERLRSIEKIASYVRKGLTHAEIGEILDLAENTVSKRISRARKQGFWPDMQALLPGVAR